MFAINTDGSVEEFSKNNAITGKRFAAVILTLEDVSKENREWLNNCVLIRPTGSSEKLRQALSQDALRTSLLRSFRPPLDTQNNEEQQRPQISKQLHSLQEKHIRQSEEATHTLLRRTKLYLRLLFQ